MCAFSSAKTLLPVTIVLATLINNVYSRSQGGFYPSYFSERNTYPNAQAAIDKLIHAPTLSPDWPDPQITLGQVSGVALNAAGHILVFHRGGHVWNGDTFNDHNVYQAIDQKAIPESTILVLHDTGKIVDMWGSNFFYMPHGITVDHEENVWLTDVAMHQVFKFTPKDKKKPALVLGNQFVPGNDDDHFCKPSAVAVMSTGDFFVADGYCNSRIIKYAADGTRLLEWGRNSETITPYSLLVPHALTLAPDRGQVCVADREHGRVACYKVDNGTFVQSYSSWLIGGRLFSVAYSPINGGRLYLVNGPDVGVRVRGYVIDMQSGKLVQSFAPDNDFRNPHDIVVSKDGSKVYVAELNPYRVYRFEDKSLLNMSRTSEAPPPSQPPGKPTHTVETSAAVGVEGILDNAAEGGWRGAVGGAGGALIGALSLAGGVALLRARARGRKSGPLRRWEYGQGEFKLRRLLERRRFTRVQSEDSEDEPAPMLPPQVPATA